MIFVLVLILIFICIAFGFLAGYFLKPDTEIPTRYINGSSINKTFVGTEQINLLLYSMEAYKLSNPPLSKNTPKIEIVVGDEVFGSEIINHVIKTKKAGIENPDLRIIIPREEFIDMLNSPDLILYLKESVRNGKIQIEILAGKFELASKGYLSLYSKISG